jgi:hypothetical protein
MDLSVTEFGDGYWIHLVQDRDHWRALMIKVINFLVP